LKDLHQEIAESWQSLQQALLLSHIIAGGVCVAGCFYAKHKKAEAARLAWEQKIANAARTGTYQVGVLNTNRRRKTCLTMMLHVILCETCK